VSGNRTTIALRTKLWNSECSDVELSSNSCGREGAMKRAPSFGPTDTNSTSDQQPIAASLQLSPLLSPKILHLARKTSSGLATTDHVLQPGLRHNGASRADPHRTPLSRSALLAERMPEVEGNHRMVEYATASTLFRSRWTSIASMWR